MIFSLINIDEAVCHFKTKYLQAGCFFFFLHVLCVFDRLDAPKLKSVLCLSVLERAAHARTHTHTHTHAHTHTHTHTRGTASFVWIVLSTFYYHTCPAI